MFRFLRQIVSGLFQFLLEDPFTAKTVKIYKRQGIQSQYSSSGKILRTGQAITHRKFKHHIRASLQRHAGTDVFVHNGWLPPLDKVTVQQCHHRVCSGLLTYLLYMKLMSLMKGIILTYNSGG